MTEKTSLFYEVIKPVWNITVDGSKNIADWNIVAIVLAKDKAEALKFGRHMYGLDVDIREAP